MSKKIQIACVGLLFWIYQGIVKPCLITLGARSSGRVCRHTPSCSLYVREMFHQKPFFEACKHSFKRIISCHPWGK